MKESCAAVLVLLFFYLVAAGMLALFLTILLAQLYELLLRLPELYAENVAPLFDQLSGWFYGLAGRFGPRRRADVEQFSGAVSTPSARRRSTVPPTSSAGPPGWRLNCPSC